MKSLESQRGARRPSVAGAWSVLLRISGCLISPPKFAALAISPVVTTDSSSTAAVFTAPDEVRRLEYHRPYHAATTGRLMKINARSAERWWRSMDALGDTGHPPDRFLRGVAGHVGRQRQQRDDEEHGEAAAFQILALLQQRQQEHPDADDHADRRKVIQQQVEMDEIRGSHRWPRRRTQSAALT
jgi:hypothetical protein